MASMPLMHEWTDTELGLLRRYRARAHREQEGWALLQKKYGAAGLHELAKEAKQFVRYHMRDIKACNIVDAVVGASAVPGRIEPVPAELREHVNKLDPDFIEMVLAKEAA